MRVGRRQPNSHKARNDDDHAVFARLSAKSVLSNRTMRNRTNG
ncbi:hypothetical protein N181_28525 [Sinorhizobium fredii USDA 205]|nr:hypothetical protein N181_28525 [Sinorhizobium fredii USDA 205]